MFPKDKACVGTVNCDASKPDLFGKVANYRPGIDDEEEKMKVEKEKKDKA